mmetsp:Transcript_36277/g.43815  ORF Transcript_36277/g.43815 Transcript_36277/m.43815 type:complete len:437 (-) Transcript_36277:401-1711(-)|eukprot:CAMPEP_0197846710 /NCGR_PEP_ID=MMETSP1438-20131217/4075_1 /TAXON_ID=1461541 /ORGANISM="Pterosperma sp., Strain CCMP1384" /LENGTH=436 /DNA_ID=CAMNT_0043458449 /DNA_START=152 /DNA_END=1462 /DNA_ORIENTATION=+
MGLAMDSALKLATSKADSLVEMIAAEPWTNIFFITLPIWLPVIALSLFCLTRSVLLKALASCGPGVRRVWLAYGAAYTVLYFLPATRLRRWLAKIPGLEPWLPTVPSAAAAPPSEITPVGIQAEASPTKPLEGREWILSDAELARFKQRIEGGKEEGVQWEEISNRSTGQVTSISWRHILPDNNTEYLTRSVFQKGRADDMFAFYGDDDNRLDWDKMYTRGDILEVDPATGADCVSWVRDFPAFITQRDYVFGRRSWTEGNKYWTVTKGCTHPARPARDDKPKRVDNYYSAWRIRPVAGITGEMDAVEVIFFHFEDFKIQQDCARLAIRMGLWGVLQNLAKGFYKYSAKRAQQREAGVEPPLPVFGPYKPARSENQVATEEGDSFEIDSRKRRSSKKAKVAAKLAKATVGFVFAAVAGKTMRGAHRRAQKLRSKAS